MAAFTLTTAARRIEGCYPSSDVTRQSLPDLTKEEVTGLVALLVTEGVPHAFLSTPLLFAAVRNFIATRLSVSAKSVTLVGSARLGYSTCAAPKFGVPFNERSDFDFAIVDRTLFERLRAEFGIWREAFQQGMLKPRNTHEAELWTDNAARVPTNIEQGFLDANRIPNLQRFPVARSIAQTMFLLIEILNSTASAPMARKASVRLYVNWNALIRRQRYNLESARKSLRQ